MEPRRIFGEIWDDSVTFLSTHPELPNTNNKTTNTAIVRYNDARNDLDKNLYGRMQHANDSDSSYYLATLSNGIKSRLEAATRAWDKAQKALAKLEPVFDDTLLPMQQIDAQNNVKTTKADHSKVGGKFGKFGGTIQRVY